MFHSITLPGEHMLPQCDTFQVLNSFSDMHTLNHLNSFTDILETQI